MTLEKRFPSALRRSAAAEGSSLATFSGMGEMGVGSAGFEEAVEGADLESSAYRLI